MSIISPSSVVLRQLKNFNAMNMVSIQKQAIKANEKELITLQQDQMRRGENSEGDNPDYSPYSLGLKLQSDTYFAPPPKMDFYNTGSFQQIHNRQHQCMPLTYSRSNLCMLLDHHNPMGYQR